MIITLIGLGLIVIGIILAIIDDKVYIKNYESRNAIECLKFVFIIFGIVMTIVTSTFVLVNVSTYDVDYQNMLHKREMLEYRIDHMEDNITGNEMLYNDIVEFNNELRSEKKWALNPWTDWFNNKDVASIDYIELDSD